MQKKREKAVTARMEPRSSHAEAGQLAGTRRSAKGVWNRTAFTWERALGQRVLNINTHGAISV